MQKSCVGVGASSLACARVRGSAWSFAKRRRSSHCHRRPVLSWCTTRHTSVGSRCKVASNIWSPKMARASPSGGAGARLRRRRHRAAAEINAKSSAHSYLTTPCAICVIICKTRRLFLPFGHHTIQDGGPSRAQWCVSFSDRTRVFVSGRQWCLPEAPNPAARVSDDARKHKQRPEAAAAAAAVRLNSFIHPQRRRRSAKRGRAAAAVCAYVWRGWRPRRRPAGGPQV